MSTSLTARRRAYVAVTITLSGAAQRILDEINTIMAAETQGDGTMVCPDACAHLAISGDAANTHQSFIGDALISSDRYGYAINPDAAGPPATNAIDHIYRSPMNSVQLGSLYALGTENEKIHVEVMTF